MFMYTADASHDSI